MGMGLNCFWLLSGLFSVRMGLIGVGMAHSLWVLLGSVGESMS